MTLTPLVEHWPDEELRFASEHPEGLDPGTLSAITLELERRTALRDQQARAQDEAREAREKIRAHEEAERARRERERAREEALRHAPADAPREALQRAIGFADIARPYHEHGFRHAALALEVLQMMLREGREAEFTEMVRGTEWSARWSYTHPRDRGVIVTFDEVFPAPTRKRAAQSAEA